MKELNIERLLLEPTDCEILRNKYPDRVAKTMIQAIYSIIDVSYDPTAAHLIKKLADAAEELIKVAKGVNALHILHEKLVCLEEAETLMRATRQRLANVPPTRDTSKLPFEMPPPSVRVIYEACEFIIDSLLSFFDEKDSFLYKPYVLIDSVDNPKHTWLSIKMPEHLRGQLSVYPALSHETFHSYAFQNKFSAEVPKDYIKKGGGRAIKSSQMNRMKLVEEIYVEMLDFIFSFLGNYENYINDEWMFFADYFKTALKDRLQANNLINYIIRTFAVKLWVTTKNLELKPTQFLVVQPMIRNLLNEHIGFIKKVLEKTSSHRHIILLNNLTNRLQGDLEAMGSVLDLIWKKCKIVQLEKKDIIEDMDNYLKSDGLQFITRSLLKGVVVNERIKYPHLLVHKTAREFRTQKVDASKELRTTMAMILSLWNAKNLESYSE